MGVSRFFTFIKSNVDAKLLKFLLVGCINTAVGMGLTFVFLNVADMGYWPSTAISYLLTSVLSFFLNKLFTFKSRGRSIGEVARFALCIALCYLLAYGIAKPAVAMLLPDISLTLGGVALPLQENAAIFLGMCLFTGLNYFGQRLFVFNGGKE